MGSFTYILSRPQDGGSLEKYSQPRHKSVGQWTTCAKILNKYQNKSKNIQKKIKKYPKNIENHQKEFKKKIKNMKNIKTNIFLNIQSRDINQLEDNSCKSQTRMPELLSAAAAAKDNFILF